MILSDIICKFPEIKIMLTVAVDFDGTIVEHAYPEIGEVKLFAFETLKELQKYKCKLILWTFRTGNELNQAVEFCRQNGIEFYAVNSNYPEEIMDAGISRKINADVYIDDKNLGGFPGWSEAWKQLSPILGANSNSGFLQNLGKKRKWFNFVF